MQQCRKIKEIGGGHIPVHNRCLSDRFPYILLKDSPLFYLACSQGILETLSISKYVDGLPRLMENKDSAQLYDANVLKYFAGPSAIFTKHLPVGDPSRSQFQWLQNNQRGGTERSPTSLFLLLKAQWRKPELINGTH